MGSELFVACWNVQEHLDPKWALASAPSSTESTMPSSTIVHAACFAVGALVGGGVATAISSNKRPIHVPASTQVQQKPIVDIQSSTGETRLSSPGALVKVDSQILKHGHPGPISDLLVRKAYTAAYDRRLRHPAWASPESVICFVASLTFAADRGALDSRVARKVTCRNASCRW